jgi:hypothetical protein
MFKKGQSGNPAGKKKGTKNLRPTLADALLEFEKKNKTSFTKHYLSLAFTDTKVACDVACRLWPALKSIEGSMDIQQSIINITGLKPLEKKE